MASDYWVMVKTAAEANASGPTPAADTFTFSTPQGSSFDNAMLQNPTGPVQAPDGQTLYLRAGPFTSESDVQAYLQTGAQNASTPIPGVDITPGGSVTLSNPLSALAGVARALADFVGFLEHVWKTITNWRAWASAGWLLVGLLMLVAGLTLYITGEISLNPADLLKLLAA